MPANYITNIRIVPVTGKLWDITNPDINEHSAPLPAGYPLNTRALIVNCDRIAGTGDIRLISVQSSLTAQWMALAADGQGIWIRAANGFFYYRLTVANDDWDIYAVAYITGSL